eukprot:347138-Pleurochrysis_carterae.AAC.1
MCQANHDSKLINLATQSAYSPLTILSSLALNATVGGPHRDLGRRRRQSSDRAADACAAAYVRCHAALRANVHNKMRSRALLCHLPYLREPLTKRHSRHIFLYSASAKMCPKQVPVFDALASLSAKERSEWGAHQFVRDACSAAVEPMPPSPICSRPA